MNKFIYFEDIIIDREDPAYSGYTAVIYQGDFIVKFPAAMADENIIECLRFVNTAYSKGFEAGLRRKNEQIKTILEIG